MFTRTQVLFTELPRGGLLGNPYSASCMTIRSAPVLMALVAGISPNPKPYTLWFRINIRRLPTLAMSNPLRRGYTTSLRRIDQLICRLATGIEVAEMPRTTPDPVRTRFRRGTVRCSPPRRRLPERAPTAMRQVASHIGLRSILTVPQSLLARQTSEHDYPMAHDVVTGQHRFNEPV